MKKNTQWIMLLCAGSLAVLTACSAVGAQRKVVQEDGKQITLLGEKPNISYNATALERIRSIPGIRAVGWLDANTLVGLKQNKAEPKLAFEGGSRHPIHLYRYDMNTNKEELLTGTKVDVWDGWLSPDRQRIFYIGGAEGAPTGYIHSFNTGETQELGLFFGDKNWMDDGTLLYTSGEEGREGIYQVDVQGNRKLLLQTPGQYPVNAAKRGKNIYYITSDYKLYRQEPGEGKAKLVSENAGRMYPSPDGEQLAITRGVGSGIMELVLMDSQEKETRLQEEGMQLEGIAWSPDGKRLAFSGSAPDGKKAGIFMADARNGEVAQLVVGSQYVSRNICWSPSGDRLLTWHFTGEGESAGYISYVMELKK